MKQKYQISELKINNNVIDGNVVGKKGTNVF